MDKVRMGVVGIGNMGQYHVKSLLEGKIARASLGAICDLDPRRTAPFPEVPHFTDSAAMIRSGLVDAVLVATPHYSHLPIGVDALSNGLHLLMEKPLCVHKNDCERLLAAHTDKKLVFSLMFMSRTEPAFKVLKEMVASGRLGALQRVSWIITDWFRTDSYYASGGWRATWKGEGGGVLINQCPHNLDMLQWICGMPSSIRAFCGLGKRHPIEVEDQVTAYMEFPNGATGVFVTSTGEAPGSNRLEIVGDLGRVILDSGKIRFTRNKMSATETLRTSQQAYSGPESEEIEVPITGQGGAHNELTQHFINAILDGTPPMVFAEEGIRQVELSNAMLYSSLTNQTVNLPLDGNAFEKKLMELIANSEEKKLKGGPIYQVPSYIK